MTLSDKFHNLLYDCENNGRDFDDIVKLVNSADESAEKQGLQALMYHDGIGVDIDLDKCFDLAEKAAFEGNDGLGYYLLGYMCENAETPDQAFGGPRQKYDHYDAERFYEICAEIDSRWREPARIWLGDYYMDSAKGGDPDVGVEYYESIAEVNAEAAGKLSDYYWELSMIDNYEESEWTEQLFKWTVKAAELNPEEYSYRMGCMYADGLGCKKNPETAMHYFSKAYSFGDWRGAKAIANCLEVYLSDKSYLENHSKTELENEIKVWNERSEKLYAEEIENPCQNQETYEHDAL